MFAGSALVPVSAAAKAAEGGRSATTTTASSGHETGRHLVTSGPSMQSYNHIQAMVPLENHHQPPAHHTQPENLGECPYGPSHNLFPDLDPNWAKILDPDPNWAKILEPDPNSMYLDPEHWFLVLLFG